MAFVAGLLAGVSSGFFGIGGGIVLVPLLGALLGLGQQDAQGVTLAVLLLPVGLPGVLAYARQVDIPWRLVGTTVLGFLLAVAPGAWAANAMDPRPLRLLFAAFVLFVAWRTWRRGSRRAAAGEGVSPGPAGREPPGGAGGAEPRVGGVAIGVVIGAAGGFLAGLLGVGGALAMIPLLVRWKGLTQREAQAVSLAVMLPPVGLPGVLAYASARGSLPWVALALVAAGFAVGAFAGARVALRARTATLKRAFAVFLVVAALGLVRAALRG